ncbi:MAG: 1-deoxy-D-xylulose-5-phosphate reductoisomerase [Endomicrobia bacterium]|nr:1-deoxy-D-xylulose-5-phosphate reductoisomerase [Endomicrobiia bacterium]
MKKVLILGSTGSIGKNVLNVIATNRDKFKVVGLSAKKNINLLYRQSKEFGVENICIGSIDKKIKKNKNIKNIFYGKEGILELIEKTKPDILVNAVVGIDGLIPTFKAIDCNVSRVAIANKESIVVGADILMKEIKRHNILLLPIDSEHSAILQGISGENIHDIKKVIITASGGPLFVKDIKNKTPDKIIKHPVWKMGKKISVDSATLVNKGLEYIEAHYLFNIPYNKIDILIHPQSFIHSFIEFVDGSIKATIFYPDMRIPISYALGCLQARLENTANRLSILELNKARFYSVNYSKFPLLKLLIEVAKSQEHSMLISFNTANEVAVEKFINYEISFDDIYRLIKKVIENHESSPIKSLNDIIEVDKLTREYIKSLKLN